MKIGGPGVIACGSEECAAGKQVCCNAEGSFQCIDADPTKVAAVSNNPYLVFGACDLKLDGGAFAAAACDDSADCPAGALCCPLALGPYLACVSNARECSGLESCREGTCRASGTSCVRGVCRPSASGTIACGPSVCTGERPVCCFQQAVKLVTDAGVQEAPPFTSCVEHDVTCPSLPFIARYECDDRSDCGSMRCCVSESSDRRGSTCAPNCLSTTTCNTDEDCQDPEVGNFNAESLGKKAFACYGGGPLTPRNLRTCELRR